MHAKSHARLVLGELEKHANTVKSARENGSIWGNMGRVLKFSSIMIKVLLTVSLGTTSRINLRDS